jgi:LPPG:FO 2-phospho-L-lactate transferase
VAAPAPVVAVSPLVRGEVVKGPTDVFMQAENLQLDVEGIVKAYDGVLDGIVADERPRSLPVLETDVLMADAASRRRLAEETLRFALALR